MVELLRESWLRGRVRAWQVDAQYKLSNISDWHSNLVMYDWQNIIVQLLQGNLQYAIAGMYLEFQNVTDTSVPVTTPTYTRADGLAYYQGLATSSNTDYLRVPLLATSLSAFGALRGNNQIACIAQSAGTVGINGKPFSHSANSVLYGIAAVSMPNRDDPTQDYVFSRAYLPASAQRLKLDNSQLAVSWELTLS